MKLLVDARVLKEDRGERKRVDYPFPHNGEMTDNSAYQQEIPNRVCTVATWKDGKITEERLFYDLKVVATKIDAMSLKT
jgi:hypothetical protein